MIPIYLIYDNKGNRYGAYRSLKEAIIAKARIENNLLFGVFTTLVQAEAAKIVVEKRLQEEIENNSFIYVKDSEDVKLDILEVKADNLIDGYLGGYVE